MVQHNNLGRFRIYMAWHWIWDFEWFIYLFHTWGLLRAHCSSLRQYGIMSLNALGSGWQVGRGSISRVGCLPKSRALCLLYLLISYWPSQYQKRWPSDWSNLKGVWVFHTSNPLTRPFLASGYGITQRWTGYRGEWWSARIVWNSVIGQLEKSVALMEQVFGSN